MNMRKKFLQSIMSLALLGLILASPGLAKTITGAANDWPPFTDPTHPQKGLSFEIARGGLRNPGL